MIPIVLKTIFRKLRYGHTKKATLYTKDRVKSPFLIVGDFTYGAPEIREWGEGSRLIIGKFCSIAEQVEIFLGGNHHMEFVSTYPFVVPILGQPFSKSKLLSVQHPVSKGDVIIGNDVWIGWGAKIFSGVTIGDGAVIGAYSVVTRNVAPYEIVAGNPLKTIRKRFDDDTIIALLDLKWWDWDVAMINDNLDLILSTNAKTLISNNDKKSKK